MRPLRVAVAPAPGTKCGNVGPRYLEAGNRKRRNQTIRYKPMRLAPMVLLGMQILAMPNADAATSYRATLSFPGSIEAFSAALGLGSADPATVLLRTVRFIYGTPESSSQRGRQTLLNALAKP